MKRIGAAVIAVCIFSALLCPFYAFAYDSRYVDELEKWSANESAEWVEFQGENASGYMQYFYGDSCAYFHIFVQSPQLAENDDSLYITADVKNKNRSYNVQISENDVEEKAPCKIYKNLGSLPDGLRNITFAIEFIDKEDKNYKTKLLFQFVPAEIALRKSAAWNSARIRNRKQQSSPVPSRQRPRKALLPNLQDQANLQIRQKAKVLRKNQQSLNIRKPLKLHHTAQMQTAVKLKMLGLKKMKTAIKTRRPL